MRAKSTQSLLGLHADIVAIAFIVLGAMGRSQGAATRDTVQQAAQESARSAPAAILSGRSLGLEQGLHPLPNLGRDDARLTNQRAAWTVGERKTPVYEAGIANLTKNETTMLVHYDKDRSQQYTLIRVEEPETSKEK